MWGLRIHLITKITHHKHLLQVVIKREATTHL
jgi:hypothetical protein